MRYVRLGQTELQVPAVAFGTWAFGGEWGAVDALQRRVRRDEVVIATMQDTAAGADLDLVPEDLAEIDAILANAVPLWGPHLEGM